MQLRRLEIVGFKSFANKSTFLFDGNVTVLAGPNGSGKSNVAEAVRWVLGEQRPSALRSRRADEVIFLGSDSRAPVGMAEVSLTMDNSEGRMGVDLDEVRITRRIYRSGESEYLLNGRRVRLRDITDRILSVGLGPDNYTVISQGAVDELIAQKPEERRVALENAADVRRHQIQLNETRSRLTTTEENLTRCRDVLAELDPQVRRMRSHADRAARAREARQELQAVSRRLYTHQYRIATQRRAVAEIRQKESAASLEIVEDELQTKEAHWKALESESESLGQELTQADQLVRDLRRQRDALQHELLGAREEQLRIEAETRAIQERQERSQREYDDLSQRSALLKSRTIEAESRREAARQELSRVVEAEREMSGAARARRDTVVASSTHLSQLRAQIERDRRNREVDEQRANELRAHQARTGDERVQLDLASAAAETAVKAATDRAAAHQVELERLESQLIETDHEIARLDAELQRVRTSVRAAEQEQARLEAAHASIDESLERLVTDAAGATLRKAHRGVLGVLGPGLRVRDGYERIISAALGDRVGHVVIDDPVAATERTRKVSEADERSALVLAEFNDSSIEASIRDLKASVGRLP
ncbi:MAG TPA: AAA family ATPase, partial [Chloroflexota bacterium]|nr:AAA family ATPase [Chloroflexota bacterium]